jgi:hypothetical protein
MLSRELVASQLTLPRLRLDTRNRLFRVWMSGSSVAATRDFVAQAHSRSSRTEQRLTVWQRAKADDRLMRALVRSKRCVACSDWWEDGTDEGCFVGWNACWLWNL